MKRKYRFSKTLSFAFYGIKHCWQHERNMRFHLAAGLMAVALGYLKSLSLLEWALLSLAISFVLALELVNTAVENVVDLVTVEYHPLAEVAKNVAAGAVLIAACNALVIGAVIFLK